MKTKFIKIRSTIDIIIFTATILTGCIFAILPIGTNANIGGYTLIIIGIILAFTLKSSYKHFHSGEKFQRKQLLFPLGMKGAIISALDSLPENIDLTKEGNAQSLRLYIYYNKQIKKAYLQLFEYSANQYDPCSRIYEYGIDQIKRLIAFK
ncbi:MAG: hypothetical protein E7081_05965 [Bacteroidales bacterium]|nr:hypothetical protein [Bacteroidales bacterium]